MTAASNVWRRTLSKFGSRQSLQYPQNCKEMTVTPTTYRSWRWFQYSGLPPTSGPLCVHTILLGPTYGWSRTKETGGKENPSVEAGLPPPSVAYQPVEYTAAIIPIERPLSRDAER